MSKKPYIFVLKLSLISPFFAFLQLPCYLAAFPSTIFSGFITVAIQFVTFKVYNEK